MSFSASSLRMIRARTANARGFRMALQRANSYLLTSPGARLPRLMQRFGGSGGILVAGGQVPELRCQLQWLRRRMINSAYQTIDGTTLTPSVCRFTVFLLNTGVSDG